MDNEIHIEHRPAQPLAVVRRVATHEQFSQVIPAACGVVWKAVQAGAIAGAGQLVAVYLDCVFHLEIGVELASPISAPMAIDGSEELIPSSTPSGRVATMTHWGPYQELGRTHTAIQKWCAAQGHTLARPSWEIYGHWQESWNLDPTQIRTDVYYLLD
jgi:effector-binding domain-containing protein